MKPEHTQHDRLNSAIKKLNSREERVVDSQQIFAFVPTAGELPFALTDVSGNGKASAQDNFISMRFTTGEGICAIALSGHPAPCNGYGFRFRLRNWAHVKYLGAGFMDGETYRYIKIPNTIQDQWIDFSIGFHDLGYGLQNEWKIPHDRVFDSLRFYVKGTPNETGAQLDIERTELWHEDLSGPLPWLGYSQEGALDAIDSNLLDVLYSALKKTFPKAKEQTDAFLETGACPLYGGTMLNWPAGASTPPDLEKSGTYKFSWHGFHPATMFLMHAHETKDLAPVFAARDFISTWLEANFFHHKAERQYTWYDHGTGERLMSMVLAWESALDHYFDARYMLRLRDAIYRHGQLLASDLFYAHNQPTRYHNHAWFQDIALMAAGLMMKDFPCADAWVNTAIARLTDQFDHLIVRDKGYAVFAENSISYHKGVQSLVEFAGRLADFSGKPSVLPDVAKELLLFSEFMKYPDTRVPTYGDTYRMPNSEHTLNRKAYAYKTPTFNVLPKAGFAVAKGNHDKLAYMLAVIASAACRTHKHADNLSFSLFYAGVEWLIDPSFHSHEYKQSIPAYLKSAEAHNALVLPGRPYSIDPGRAHLKDTAHEGSAFRIEGSHQCYEGFTISRDISGSLDKLDLKFIDRCDGDAANASLMLHCGEFVNASLDGDTLILTHPLSAHVIVIKLPNASAKLYKGHVSDELTRGVTGLTFMNHTDIFTIECTVPCNQSQNWSIFAELKA